MVESFTKKFHVAGPVSHAKGSKLINRAWVTKDLALREVSILPQSFSPGDHRVILVNLNVN